jgi:hypothetical protein
MGNWLRVFKAVEFGCKPRPGISADATESGKAGLVGGPESRKLNGGTRLRHADIAAAACVDRGDIGAGDHRALLDRIGRVRHAVGDSGGSHLAADTTSPIIMDRCSRNGR